MLKIAWHPNYKHNLPSGHRFPMEKYELIPEQLLYENTISEENLHVPGMITNEILSLVHSAEYIEKLDSLNLSPPEIRKTGFPLSQELIDREKTIMQGLWTAPFLHWKTVFPSMWQVEPTMPLPIAVKAFVYTTILQ